jgi:hypothetical protein
MIERAVSLYSPSRASCANCSCASAGIAAVALAILECFHLLDELLE